MAVGGPGQLFVRNSTIHAFQKMITLPNIFFILRICCIYKKDDVPTAILHARRWARTISGLAVRGLVATLWP
jgi:hypothetical protein